MKKYKTTFSLSIFLILIVSAVLFTSCNKITNNSNNTNFNNTINNNTSNNAQKTNYTIKDYYPFIENLRFSYAGSGNEYASKDVYVDFIKGNKIQLRSINGGTTMGQVLQNGNGELKLIFSIGEFYYRDDLTSYQSNVNEIILKEPLKKGTSWTLSDGRNRSITGIDIAIDTPSGNYKALEVTTTGNNYTLKDYYVVNMGLVKTVFTSEGSDIVTSLKNSIPNSTVAQTIKFYYPKITDTDVDIMFKKNTINLKTNDEIKNIFQNNFNKTIIDGTAPLMSANTKINKLYLNYTENVVYVDFSKEFITEMNAGTSLESGILTSVVNTLGDYYNVKEVRLTVDGKEYSSGHILMQKGENFKVNFNGVAEVK